MDEKNIENGRVLYDIDDGIVQKYRDNPPRLQSSNDIVSNESTGARFQSPIHSDSSINNNIPQNTNTVNTAINSNYMQDDKNNTVLEKEYLENESGIKEGVSPTVVETKEKITRKEIQRNLLEDTGILNESLELYHIKIK